MDSSNSILQGSEEEVRGAIGAFEEILQAMPNDRVALETLFEGHLLLKNLDKAAEYLVRLVHTILEEDDSASAAELLPALQEHSALSPDVAKARQQVESLLGLGPTKDPHPQTAPSEDKPGKEAPPPPPPSKALATNDITAELSMAWTIHQASVFDEEEYSAVVHDLSELCSRNLDVPVTVLHVLDDRNSSSLEKVIEFVAKDCNTPYISLSRFDLNPLNIEKSLPESIARQQGALVFDEMGGDQLVAILNPYDKELFKSVKSVLGEHVHFYLTTAAEYDEALKKLYPAQTASDMETPDVAPPAESSSGTKKLGLRLKS